MNRILNDAGFRTHLIIYAAVNGGLALINLVSAPTHVWFQWPLIGWGIGLLGHAFLISRAPETQSRTNAPVNPTDTATLSSSGPKSV